MYTHRIPVAYLWMCTTAGCGLHSRHKGCQNSMPIKIENSVCITCKFFTPFSWILRKFCTLSKPFFHFKLISGIAVWWYCHTSILAEIYLVFSFVLCVYCYVFFLLFGVVLFGLLLHRNALHWLCQLSVLN